MQKLDNLAKWQAIAGGDVILLGKETARTVKIHVNAPVETRLFYTCPGEPAKFLATVKGRDTVMFNHKGPMEVSPDNDIYFYTSENETIHNTGSGAEKLTKIMERQPRDPRFEAMAHQMMMNVNRRLAQQQSEYEGLLKQERAARKKADEKAAADRHAKDAPKDNEGGSEKKAASDKGADDKKSPAPKEKAEAAE